MFFGQLEKYILNLARRVLTNDTNNDTIPVEKMGSIDGIFQQAVGNPNDVRFADLCKICDYYFGKARQKGGHHIYKMPWQGDPRINIQDDNGKAKAYQVRQVIRAVKRLKGITWQQKQ